MHAPRNPRSAGAVEAFTEIMGRRHVLTSARATAPYAMGDRFGAGEVLAVLRSDAREAAPGPALGEGDGATWWLPLGGGGVRDGGIWRLTRA